MPNKMLPQRPPCFSFSANGQRSVETYASENIKGLIHAQSGLEIDTYLLLYVWRWQHASRAQGQQVATQCCMLAMIMA